MRLVPWQPDDMLRRLDDVVGVYGEAMGYRAELLQTRRGYIGAHVRRAGFRAVATLTTDGHLAGFGYGYASGPGQWWHDQVRTALAEPARRHWLGHCFEVVELHVRPSAQGHGIGARQLRALLAMAEGATVLLSTPEADEQKSRAWRLYRRFGFADVLRDFIFPGDERAFAILGRELPLAGRPATEDAPGSSASEKWLIGRDRALPWALLGALILTQICYPLTEGGLRAGLTVLTVVLGYLLSVSHALLTRGARTAGALISTATLGGFAVEALGVATGFPFGTYDYSGQLGPKLLGVPLIIPLAWTWMAWPAWLAALRLTRSGPARIALAAAGLAAWDLFLDPQMVAEGYWTWDSPTPALPGVPGIPVGNYLGWLGFAVLLMAGLAAAAGPRAAVVLPGDTPMLALWWWTYASSVLAHAVFLGLPASALWGGVLMGAVVLPLAIRRVRGTA